MRLAIVLAVALLLVGSVESPTRVSVSAPLLAPLAEREILLIDALEDVQRGTGDTTIWWTPKSGSGRVAFVGKFFRDPKPKAIDLLDAKGHVVGSIQLGIRTEDGYTTGDTVIQTKGEVHFALPHAGGNQGVSAKIDEPLTKPQWDDLDQRGGNVRIQIDTGPGKECSPMVRALGKTVALTWRETGKPQRANRSTDISLIGDAKTLDKVSTKLSSGTLKGPNSGSIQFDIRSNRGQRRHLELSFH